MSIAAASAACTKTVILKEKDPLRLSASPPAKPEPPPEPEPPPRVEVKKEKIQVNEKIFFDYNKATIREESHNLLDEIASVITEHPELVKIRIEGHTDSVGSHKFNMKLSKRRAKAVREYLVGKGVDTARLESEGYAFDKPIDTNDTDEGRAKNRRVEFTILERNDAAADAGGDDAGGDDAGDDASGGGGDEAGEEKGGGL